MTKPRRRFTREFKLDAVRRVMEEGQSQAQVARDLDIRADGLRRWVRQVEQRGDQAFPGSGRVDATDERLRLLLQENQRLREERDTLKKAMAICSRL